MPHQDRTPTTLMDHQLPISRRRLGLWTGFTLGWFTAVLLNTILINLI